MKQVFIALILAATGFAFNAAASNYNSYRAKANTCSQLQYAADSQGAIRVLFKGLFGENQSRVAFSRQVRNACGYCYKSLPFNVKAKNGWCTVGRVCVKDKRKVENDDDYDSRGRRQRRECQRAPYLEHR